jgi:hypothetical protein
MNKAQMAVMLTFWIQAGAAPCTFRHAGEGIPDAKTMHQSHMCAVEEWKGNSVNWCSVIGNKQATHAKLFQDC